MTPSQSAVLVFLGAMILRTRSTSTSPPPPGQRVEARVAQPRERLGDRQLRAPRDVLDLGRRERVEVDLVARLDAREEVLVPLDAEIGVVAALHQHGRAAERERLLDLLVDHRLGQDVALARVARAPVEGAEVAVGDADVRVVDVPVDDERDLVGIGLARAHLVGRAADRDEVARAQQRRGVVVLEPARPRAPARESPATGRVATSTAIGVSVRERWRRSATRARPESRRARRPGVEALEAGALALAEAVAELLEVAREVAGREAVALAGGLRDEIGVLGGLGDGAAQRAIDAAERVGVAVALRRPDGEHHRQARALAPERAEVVVRRRDPRTPSAAPRRRSAGARRPPRPRARISAWGTSTRTSATEVAESLVTAMLAHGGQRQLA